MRQGFSAALSVFLLMGIVVGHALAVGHSIGMGIETRHLVNVLHLIGVCSIALMISDLWDSKE